ncbi:MAG: Ni/Fe hydrogenase subunit alpha [Parvibaculaceae bacterium]
MATKEISVDYIARVEGEGALKVVIENGVVGTIELNIFEPPRFFEALLEGRDFREAPDITARICGICPVAYQMSSVQAMEQVCGADVPQAIRDLRRLLYCGEWIESHALHIYMLHAPDFLGFEGAIDMAREAPEIVERGLQLKKAGNDIMALLGGREVHPINVKVGGFYKVPSRKDFEPLRERLAWAREAALETVRWVSAFDFPDDARDYEFVALGGAEAYPIDEGRIVSNRGLDIPAVDFEKHIVETHVAHSNALHAHIEGRGSYAVGPLARYNLNAAKLPSLVQEAAKEAGLSTNCRSPSQSIIVRSLEVLYACDEALRIIDGYTQPDAPAVAVEPRAGTGYACTEAPRGILYHRYEIDDGGAIKKAVIVPPTSQNQLSIEEDLRATVTRNLDKDDDVLQALCEQAIRNYDPCISCATHFLRFDRVDN